MPLNRKSYWTHTFILLQVVCVKSCEPKVSAHSENIPFFFFPTAEGFFFPAGFRALPGVEHLWEKIRMLSQRRFSPTLCACFPTGRGDAVWFKVCYSSDAPQEPLGRYLFCFYRLSGPHGRSVFMDSGEGWTEEQKQCYRISMFFVRG